ncbi:MAG TPA: amidohydrolase, partial [Firmicutes bacterium]|nr:amidohydrolase [Bacillota bacterium]
GLSDAHLHFLGLGLQFLQVDVTGLDKASTLATVGEKAKGVRPGEWLRGGRWNQVLWGTQDFPTAADLDTVAPDVPVVLSRVDGHAIWVNTAALKAAGITRDTPDPAGGHIVKDANGEPTGILIDKAMDLVYSKMPDWSPAQKLQALQLADRHLVSLGITSAHDAGADEDTIDLVKQAYTQGKIRLRLYEMLDKEAAEKRIAAGRRPEIGLYGGKLTVRAIKLLADGAMGSRGAAFFGDYSDQPGWKGLLILNEDEIYKVAKGALGLGYQVCTHAIGDQANNATLNAYERASREAGLQQTPRFRVEHAQAIRLTDIPRFAQLGVIASMQPCHATSDMNMAETRIGPFRILGAYAWRSLLNTGAHMAGGTDAPVEPADPFNNLHAAVTRSNHDGLPTGGWYPEQKMTRLEALRSLTAEAAYAAFEEKDRGTLEVGKLADLVVMSDNYLTCPEQELWRLRAMMTVIGGQIVWRLGD